MKADRRKSILYLALAACLWSTGGLFIKLINMNPIAIAGIRSGIAAIVMFLYLGKARITINKINIAGACTYAVLLFSFVGANKLTTSANAIFLQFTSPIWVIIITAVVLKEKIKRADCITVAAVLSGMLLFFIGSFGKGTIFGNVIACFSGVFQALLVILLQKHKEGSVVEVTLLGNVLAFLISIPFLPHQMPPASSVLYLLLLGVLQLGIPYIFYTLAVKRVSSMEAILIPVLEPLLNPLWVFLFTGEKVAWTALLGGFIVISSIVINEFMLERGVRMKEAAG